MNSGEMTEAGCRNSANKRIVVPSELKTLTLHPSSIRFEHCHAHKDSDRLRRDHRWRVTSLRRAYRLVLFVRISSRGCSCRAYDFHGRVDVIIFAAAVSGKEIIQNLLTVYFPVTDESLNLYRTVRKKLYFPTLPWRRDVDHYRL